MESSQIFELDKTETLLELSRLEKKNRRNRLDGKLRPE